MNFDLYPFARTVMRMRKRLSESTRDERALLLGKVNSTMPSLVCLQIAGLFLLCLQQGM